MKERKIDIPVCITILIASATSISRIWGMMKQHDSNELKRSCFTVESGRLIQTPFNLKCLSKIDIVVLALFCSSAFLFIGISIWIIRLLLKKKKKSGNVTSFGNEAFDGNTATSSNTTGPNTRTQNQQVWKPKYLSYPDWLLMPKLTR